MAEKRVVIKGTNFWGNPKEIESNQLEMISSYISSGDELEIQLMVKTISNLVIFEYGPILTLHEINKFVDAFITQLSSFKKDRKEIFSQMLNVFSNSKDDNYVIKSTCLLIRKTPYCVLVKFGDIKNVRFIFDLDVSTLYILGKETNSIPFDESEYLIYEQMYEELKKDFLRREQERIRSNFVSFKEKLKEDTSLLVKDAEVGLHNCAEYEKAINKNIIKANENQIRLSIEEEKTKNEMSKLNRNMLFVETENSKHKTAGYRARINLPNEDN